MKDEKEPTYSVATFVSVATLLLLLAVAARSFAINAEQIRKMRVLQKEATHIPSFGSLTGLGFDLRGWSAPDASRFVFVFPLSAARASSENRYWTDVVHATEAKKVKVDFVGVCDRPDECGLAGHGAPFTTLAYMDPYQMHIVSIANHQRLGLLYLGKNLAATIAIGGDTDDLAATIAQSVTEGAKR